MTFKIQVIHIEVCNGLFGEETGINFIFLKEDSGSSARAARSPYRQFNLGLVCCQDTLLTDGLNGSDAALHQQLSTRNTTVLALLLRPIDHCRPNE